MIGETPSIPDPVPGTQQPERESVEQEAVTPKEIGGRDGPEPTRYGDWEKNGRCIDF
ncbi:DUF1674 domain-containing protein [Pseudoxanthomonas sp. CF125]|uniref:DUF1674 domain-containing protein n=1 Tax=Pseudoxanthomonas sp. CF125 TaxID=1855303 RepID=UPI000881057C|nr:DUF1674 domain-containing protein [Pseudoxanthomonas sp. CF125]SDQ36603.1 Protein of unknown function [Pseudoxanthomonas sp. CF125]